MGHSTPGLGPVHGASGNILRLLREASITPNRLASLAGIPRQSLHRKLNATPEEFKLRELDNIAAALGDALDRTVTVIDLLDDEAA